MIRNRIKRLVREFARRQSAVDGRDIVVIARPSAARLSGLAAVSAELEPVWARGLA